MPVLCFVTDRRQMARPSFDGLVATAAAAAEAGVDLIQVREPDVDAASLLALTRRIVAAAAGTGAVVLVNDRLDVAIAAGAGGVHLRGDSMPPDRVRACVPQGFLVGQSIHDVAGAVAAGTHADYLIMGTVYPTRSKSLSWPLAGIEGLRAVCRAAAVPVLAIGGMTPDRAGEISAAGAAGLAGISLFADAANSPATDLRAAFGAVVQAVREGFRRGGTQRFAYGSGLPLSAD